MVGVTGSNPVARRKVSQDPSPIPYIDNHDHRSIFIIMWESFKNLSKKILLGFVALFTVLGIANLISDQIQKQALVIDEEIALECALDSGAKAAIILLANKRSRKTDKYWDSILVKLGQKSEISEDKRLYKLTRFPVQERNIDYVVANVTTETGSDVFLINREDYSLTIENVEGSVECVQVDGDKIRNEIKQTNSEVEAKNKL